jgi:hypothetical protein
LINLAPKQETNEEWERIKTAIVDAAREVLQTQGKSPWNVWWDEECRKIIQENNEARKKWLQLKTRTSRNTLIKEIKQIKFAHKRRKSGLAIKQVN